jgi:hypothetical protein
MTWFADRIATPARAWWDSRPAAGGPWRHQLLREVGLVAALFALYNIGRLLAAQRVAGAFDNADRLWELERWLGLPSEQAWQAVAMDVPSLIRAANGYYASVHFPLTFLVLLWLFLQRPDTYLWARRSIVWGSAAALVVQVLLPMAPPRMLDNLGFIDTGVRYGQSVYGTVGQDPLANQFAAMPSLHVGWAVLLAVVCISSGQTRRRWLWVLHPVITTLVVVVTANHYWLDGVVGALVIVGALWFLAPRRSARDSQATLAPASSAAAPPAPVVPAPVVPAPVVPAPAQDLAAHRAPEPLLPTQRRSPSAVPPPRKEEPGPRSGAETVVRTGTT